MYNLNSPIIFKEILSVFNILPIKKISNFIVLWIILVLYKIVQTKEKMESMP